MDALGGRAGGRPQGSPLDRLLRCRWVLSWKTSGAAKARMVIVGFTDPDLAEERREAPTVSKRARMLCLQMAATHRWPAEKGDVISSFLQCRDKTEEHRQIYMDPVDELRESLKMGQDQIVQILKAGYGLTNAPRRWWQQVKKDLEAAGGTPSRLEACVCVDGP